MLTMTSFDMYTFAGEKAIALLHGQLSAHVQRLLPMQITPTCLCNPQGRMLANGFVALDANSSPCLFFPHLCQARVRTLIDRLLPFFQVTMQVVPCDVTQLPNPQDFSQVMLNDPNEHLWCATIDSSKYDTLHSENTVDAHAAIMWYQQWWKTGVVFLHQERHLEKYIPSDWGWNTFAVSFTKGCYIGQEIIARVHYRGKPKKRFVVGEVDMLNPPDSVKIIGMEKEIAVDAYMALETPAEQAKNVQSWLVAMQIPIDCDNARVVFTSDSQNLADGTHNISPTWLRDVATSSFFTATK